METGKKNTDYLKQYKKLTFTDDFMFGKIMNNNPDVCKEMLSLLLNVAIDHIKYAEIQKSIETSSGAKGVRLDAFIKDENGTVYDIEMQTADKHDIAERSRYYHGVIDVNLLKHGKDYKDLKKSFVIFICAFDLKDYGNMPVLNFQFRCDQNPDIVLGDGSYTVLINAYGSYDGCSDELKYFLNYIKTGETGKGKLVQMIHELVLEARENEEWGEEYMTMQIKMNEKYTEGIKKGIILGKKEGMLLGKKEGMLLGEKTGEQKAIFSFAKKLLSMNYSETTVAELTGLKLSEIRKLK